MSYRKEVVVTGASASNGVPLDRWLSSPVIVGVKVSGTVTYSVQHTFDDPFKVGGLTNATWYNHGNSVFVSATANAEDNFIAAPAAVRLVTFASSTGEATMTIQQNGGFPT